MSEWNPSPDPSIRTVEFGLPPIDPQRPPAVPPRRRFDLVLMIGGLLALLLVVGGVSFTQGMRVKPDAPETPGIIRTDDNEYLKARREFLADVGREEIKSPEVFIDETAIEAGPKPLATSPVMDDDDFLAEPGTIEVRFPNGEEKRARLEDKSSPAVDGYDERGASNRLDTKTMAPVAKSPSASVTEWTWYDNPEFGVRVPYPQGWGIKQFREGDVLRVTFSGGGNVSIMVEVNRNVPGNPPASAWESMDARFRETYGRKYNSLGIRDATLGGHPAAAWTFDLTRGGTLRKIDVGAVVNNNGYAVLASAPPAIFEDWRKVFQRVIDRIEIG